MKFAGDVAIEVAQQLADPVRALRDRLGLVVDQLERHVTTSTGPTPYPWRALQVLRQDVASAYLEATHLARRLDELDRALHVEPPAWVDVGAAVDLGLRLAGHHVAAGIELLFDLGSSPPARGAAGLIALVVSQMVAACARSAREVAGSSLSVRVTSEPGVAIVAIADNGGGDEDADAIGEVARGVVAAWGGTVEATSAAGQGCTFEIRLVTG